MAELNNPNAMTTYTCTIPSPVGAITLTSDDDALLKLDLDTENPYTEPSTPILRLAKRQIDEYFAGVRLDFDIPIRVSGTDFQIRVWNALRKIPYGCTASYGDVAAMIGNPRAARAVGNANHNNPIALLIPCHRVINADGSLGGYGGGEHIKKYLLEFENGGGNF